MARLQRIRSQGLPSLRPLNPQPLHVQPLRSALLVAAALALGGGAAQAAVCVRPGFPVGCTVGADPVVNPTPGVGYGAPGVGVRPGAGPGVGPNYGGPANYHPAAGPGVGPNAGGPVNRAGWR
ncbi:hypothetical protein KBZ20_10935 [Vulcanococcus limneticus Candia 3F8]|uniref:hypothetical protein n=1 Tax=Vulcanococcus limneticus TaxID=2170428 RepID=UPI0018E30C2A|nr:hypothetical protein [Vulcanococcus limneticus]MCP9792256.1 hypothetical protein [Vulcanococcus limneticus MW73D5]MCP9894284.1 hypothetical protein [Vulcanococcus limneticus Candia 3F8]MCP9897905.1 hypothetical protein [Vulcanococcus limneticus Candia 3B3]